MSSHRMMTKNQRKANPTVSPMKKQKKDQNKAVTVTRTVMFPFMKMRKMTKVKLNRKIGSNTSREAQQRLNNI